MVTLREGRSRHAPEHQVRRRLVGALTRRGCLDKAKGEVSREQPQHEGRMCSDGNGRGSILALLPAAGDAGRYLLGRMSMPVTVLLSSLDIRLVRR